MVSPWRGWRNAEIYHSFVDRYPIYRALNRHLASLAQIESGRRVLDLACGSGATSAAILRLLPPDGELVGVDASEEMIEVARSATLDPRARFVVGPAAESAGVLAGHFDRALCNAAIWQFPSLAPVLASLETLLSPGALFAFNVPAERVEGEASEIHPFQVALARAIEQCTGLPFPRHPTTLRIDAIERHLDEHRFDLVERRRFVYRGRQEEMIELMAIPAMIGPLTPGLSPEERHAIIRDARAQVDPDEPIVVPWIEILARRR